jgi:hypothetical protein
LSFEIVGGGGIVRIRAVASMPKGRGAFEFKESEATVHLRN